MVLCVPQKYTFTWKNFKGFDDFFSFSSYFPDALFLLKGNLRRPGSNFIAFP